MIPPCYEVYALRYATHASRCASENFMLADPHADALMPLDFFLWAIKGPGTVIVVDTGCAQETARSRQRTFLQSPLELLTALGIHAQEVTDLVITHMHYDHCGNVQHFPRARIHLQEDEMAYCTGPCMGHPLLRHPFEAGDIIEMVRCLFDGRIAFHRGSSELTDGIFLHQVGGHTRGMQIVCVPTVRGQVVLASDAVHLWDNIRARNPFPILVDVAAVLESYTLIEALADGPDHIIPGHDPRVMRVFPALQGNSNIALLHAQPEECPT